MDQLRPLEPIIAEQVPGVNNLTDFIIPSLPTIEKEETKTKEFVLDEMKEQPGKVKIDFFGSGNPNSFINQPTETAKPDVAAAGNYINSPQTSSNSFGISTMKTKEEIRGNVSTIIAVIDYGASFLGMAISGEKNQTAFTADNQQKKILETALVDYMYEKQTKLSPTLALLLAFLGAYGFMLGGAIKTAIEKYKNKKALGASYKENIKDLNWPSPTVKDQVKSNPPSSNGFEGQGKIKEETPFVLTQPSQKTTTAQVGSSHTNPDPNIIATSNQHITELISKGIYPMYKRNISNNKTIKINYDSNGKPKLQGKPTRAYSYLKTR